MSEAADAAGDIIKRMQLFALPILDGLTNLRALAALWKSGRSPGLTERQRIKFLDELHRDSNAT